jgi:hypothetical protein
MSQRESRLSREINSALEAMGAFSFKVHGGPTMMNGLPDIIACIPHPETGMGLFVGLETKLDTEVSAIQAHRHAQIRRAGGGVVVPHSVAEALDYIAGYITPITRR